MVPAFGVRLDVGLADRCRGGERDAQAKASSLAPSTIEPDFNAAYEFVTSASRERSGTTVVLGASYPLGAPALHASDPRCDVFTEQASTAERRIP